MSLAMLFAIVAVIAVALFALVQRSGRRPPETRTSFPRLVAAAAAIWFGLIALGLASFFVGHMFFNDDPEPLADPENLTVPCAAVDDELVARLEANLVGDPAPTIENATTAAFDVDGQEFRVVVAPLIELPEGRDDSAVFIIDSSETVYASAFPEDEISAAEAYSTFETASFDPDVWTEPIDYAIRCPPFGEA